MKLPTDWQCRHIFPILITVGFLNMFMGLYFIDGFLTWMGILLIVATSIVFGCVLPEHNDPWKPVECHRAGAGYACAYARHKTDVPCGICPLKSQREAAESADGKPDGQAENASLSHGEGEKRS